MSIEYIVEKSLSYLKSKNLTEFEIYGIEKEIIEIKFMKNILNYIKSNTITGIGFRIIINKKVGTYGTYITNIKDIENGIENSIILHSVRRR